LPPVGSDEIGRLGFAVRRFQETAAQADQREAELRSTNRQLEMTRVDLEQKAHQLEEANKTLEYLSATDSLTGLANRRRFDEVLATEWARAGRASHSLTLIMLDIDYFKQFNDTYGHRAGDTCLQKIALTLQKKLGRAGDLLARYGGEEFCVISAYTDRIGAQALAEKIRLAVWDLALAHEESPFGFVTVSVGIAVAVPQKGQSVEGLLHAADQALYEAKTRGRNCIK
jgi:diguanylate cyclase (GGDEF)-like protein